MDVVLGIGNPWRRDDGAGPAVARRLTGRLPESVRVRTLGGEAAELLDAFQGATFAVLIDAMESGAHGELTEPGTVRRFDAAAGPLPASFSRLSSHGLGVPEALELARTLGHLPPNVLVYGIEGADFTPGQGLSPEVERAVRKVASELIALLADQAPAQNQQVRCRWKM